MRGRRAWTLLLLLLGGCGDTLWAEVTRRLPAGDPIPAAEESEPEGRRLRLSFGGRATNASLLQELGERRLWRTGSGLVVAMDGARVVATSGLREVLAATRFEGPDPLASPAALLDRPAEARRLVDLMRADRAPDGMRFGVAVKCRLRAGRVPADPGLLLIEERCRAAEAGAFTNRFWADAESGEILRAEQWVGPGLPSLTVEFLSP